MSVAKSIEITATSEESFEAAINDGLGRASKSVGNMQGAWIQEQKVAVKDGGIAQFRIDMKVTYMPHENA